MIFDKTGLLANMSRHDYLPFGEELSSGVGLRSSSQGYTAAGYSAADKARQKFTGQERDDETGLDYMNARYFASVQGRFTSADTVAGSIGNPQSLNRYAYVGNNPLNFSDPTGHLPSSSPTYSPTFSEGDGGWSWDDPSSPQAVLNGLGILPGEVGSTQLNDFKNEDDAVHPESPSWALPTASRCCAARTLITLAIRNIRTGTFSACRACSFFMAGTKLPTLSNSSPKSIFSTTLPTNTWWDTAHLCNMMKLTMG